LLYKKSLTFNLIIMKKLLLFKKMIIILLLVGLSSAGWAQVLLTEHFDYPTPAFIGGNGGAAGSTSNNWVTHSVTTDQTTTIDIQDGSLTYDGFAGSTGNKVYLFSNANAISRDVNRAFTSTATTFLYYSALINIIDNTQLTAFDNYFMHFGATAGASNSTFGGRLGVKSTNSGANFQFLILNTSSPSGTTTVMTPNGTDLTFGTTYLVVVKYDMSVNPTVATMWINPTLGGTEPAGGITNNSGVNTFPTFASICLRNNATTPKAYIDEIRVGVTWTDVTPFSNVGINMKEQRQTFIYPNPATTYFNVKAPEGKYLVSVNNSIGKLVKTSDLNSTGKIEISDLSSGLYFVTVENLNTKQKEVHKLMVK